MQKLFKNIKIFLIYSIINVSIPGLQYLISTINILTIINMNKSIKYKVLIEDSLQYYLL